MKIKKIIIEEDFITLTQLLKCANLVASGGEAHLVITEGMVKYNDVVDFRKRLKVKKGDRVQFQNTVIIVE